MNRPDEASLLSQFLGDSAATGDPFDILALERSSLTESEVLAARDRRIHDVDLHPLARTPQADEIRLAIHAAAANLLNPHVVESLLTDRPAPPAVTSVLRAPVPKAARSFERDVFAAIGLHGGWGAKAQRHVLMLAGQHGLPARSVSASLSRLAPKRAMPKQHLPRVTVQSQYTPKVAAETEPIDETWKIAAGVGAALLVSAAMLSILVVIIIRTDSPSKGITPSTAKSSVSVKTPFDTRSNTYIPETRADLDTANIIAHELRSATAAAVAGHEDAIERYRVAAETLGIGWTTNPRDAVRAANEAAVAFWQVSDQHAEAALKILESLGETRAIDAASFTQSVWADGILAIASGDPSLSARARETLLRHFKRLGTDPSSPTFAGGIETGLTARLRWMKPKDTKVWNAWIQAHEHSGLVGTTRGDVLLIDAMDILLRHPDVPDPHTFDTLAGATTWRQGSETQVWLLRQFDAADVSTSRLSMLLRSIAESSAAPDIIPDMVLPSTASQPERDALRDRYANSWGLSDQDSVPDELSAAVRRELAEAAQAARSINGPVNGMIGLLRLARANAMAARLVAGDAEAVAEELLLELTRIDELQELTPRSQFDVNAPIEGDGEWGGRVLDIDPKDSDALVSAAIEIRSRSLMLGPADSGVLARLSFRGSGVPVRAEASRSLIRHANSPHMLLAVLDMLESIPRSEANGLVLESVTGKTVWTGSREDFYVNARKGILDRILGLIADHTTEASIDRSGELLDGLYHWASTGESIDLDAPPAASSASLLARKIQANLERGVSNAFDGLMRRSSAGSPAEQFLAEQWALAGAVAASTVDIAPEQENRIRTIKQSLMHHDDRAGSLLEQILAAERALAELWQLRLEVVGS